VPEALQLLQHSLELCTRIGYDDGAAWPLTLFAQACLWSGDDSTEVQRMFKEGRGRFIAMGEAFGQAHANMFLPNSGERTVERQLRYGMETMALAERPGADPLLRAIAFHNLAFAVWECGHRARAEGLNRLAAKDAVDTSMTVNSGMAFLQAAEFAGEQGPGREPATRRHCWVVHLGQDRQPRASSRRTG
jgi:hypothetical protein